MNKEELLQDLVKYIEDHTGMKLEPEQIKILEDLLNFTIHNQLICCGRGLGKSTLSCGFALWLIDCYSKIIGEAITVLLASHQNVIYDYLETYFQKDPSLAERLKTKGFTHTFPEEGIIFKDTNSHLYIRLDTSRQIRGFHTWIVILDEAQSVPKDLIIKDFRKCATEKIAKFVMMGTPETNTYLNEVLEGCMKKSKKYDDWILSQYPTEGIERLKARIESDAKELGRDSLEYITEVLATIPLEENKSPFKKLLKKCYCEVIEPSNELGYVNTLGIDLGFGLLHRNACGLVAVQRFKNKRKCKPFYRELSNPDMDHVIDVIRKNNIKLVIVDYKPVELKDKVKAEVEPLCKGTKFVYLDTTNIKGNLESHLAELMESGNLDIPTAFTDLYHELEKYYRKKASGKNLADSLILACYNGPEATVAPDRHGVVTISDPSHNQQSWQRRNYLGSGYGKTAYGKTNTIFVLSKEKKESEKK